MIRDERIFTVLFEDNVYGERDKESDVSHIRQILATHGMRIFDWAKTRQILRIPRCPGSL